MTLFHALFLGTLQGLTEFLPISSSGHLAISQHFMSGFRQPGVLFDVLLHVGTMFAVILYFRREIFLLITSPMLKNDEARVYRKLLLLIIVGTVPTAAIGLAFKDFFEGLFHNLTLVSLMLLVTGLLLFLSERFRREGRREENLTFSDALIVGAIQGCAIIPGISRSGSTIATLLFKGVDGETAARFSFLLALPAIFGAALLQIGELGSVAASEIPIYLSGMAVAFLFGLISIHFLMAVIRKKRLFAFALYCWTVGLTFFALSL